MVSSVPYQALTSLGADSSFLGNNDRRTAWGTVGPGRGRCVATGNRAFRLKFYAVELNKEGVVWGFLQVQANLTFSESSDGFTTRVGSFLMETGRSCSGAPVT